MWCYIVHVKTWKDAAVLRLHTRFKFGDHFPKILKLETAVTHTNTPWVKTTQCTDLFRPFDSVSEERRLVLTVVKQDVERHLAAQHVVDGLLHHAVEVSGRVRVVQHVVDLIINDTMTLCSWLFDQLIICELSLCHLVFFPQQIQWIQFDLWPQSTTKQQELVVWIWQTHIHILIAQPQFII